MVRKLLNLKEIWKDAIDCFLRGLKPELEIRIGTANKFDEIVERAIREERNLTARNELRRGNRQHSLVQQVEKSSYNSRDFAKTNKINLAREEPIKCKICQKIGHTAATCFQYVQQLTNKKAQSNQFRNNQKLNQGQNFEVICYSCNTPGHTSRNCSKKINTNQQLPQQPQQQQFQQQEFIHQENPNALPGTGAQRRA